MGGHYYVYDWENANIIQLLYVTLFHVYPEITLRGKKAESFLRALEEFGGLECVWNGMGSGGGGQAEEMLLEM